MSAMNRHYTDQDRIDEQTMRIENPNVVGSGYIQFPPQRPFEKPVQVQPPTVAHLDHPDEYQNYSRPTPPAQVTTSQTPAVHGPQAPEGPRLNGTSLPAPHYATQPNQAGTTPAASAVRHDKGAAPQTGSRLPHAIVSASRPQQRQHTQQQSVATQSGPQRSYAQSSSAQNSQPRQPPAANGYHIPAPQARPAAASVAAPAPAAAARPSAAVRAAPQAPAAKPDESLDEAADTSQLTKAQKQRLRKKLREGRV